MSTEQLPHAMRWMAAGWIVIVLVSLAWNISEGWSAALQLTQMEARMAIEKDLVFRRWAAAHGGVYVPITAATPPNPYLQHIPGRDLVTTDGQRLTLINPAYMTRQVHELGVRSFGLHAHITSLRPLRPENAADAWEEGALRAFERGAQEVSGFAAIDGVEHLRLMRPLRVEPDCLKCHQGYQVGELRGGMSASVPRSRFTAALRGHVVTDLVGHGLFGVLGLLGLAVARRRLAATLAAEQEASAALRSSEGMFRTLVAAAGDGFECLDAFGRFVEVNDETCRQLGYTRDELLRLTIADVDPRVNLASFMEEVRGLVDRPAIMIESVHRRKDGTLFPVEIKASAVRHETGLRALALVRDVTERKRAELALAASERQFRTIVEATTEGVWTVDAQCRTVFVNRRLTELLGYSVEELAGQPPENFMFAEDLADHGRQIAARRAGRAAQYERRFRRKDGTAVWTLTAVAPIQDEAGDFGGAIAMLTNITERRHADEALRARHEELTRFNRAATGRELRMIELKREVNELCRRCGEPPRYPLEFTVPPAEARQRA